MKVFIPLHKKDLVVLPYCIRSLRQYLLPRASDIFVVGSGDLERILEAKKLGTKFINQNELVTGLNFEKMPKIVIDGEDRSGWYFQQFLKLGISFYIDDECYAVFDADNVLVRRVKLISEKGYVFYVTKQYHRPYFDTCKKIIGNTGSRKANFSFISDFMVFDSAAVRKMCDIITKKTGKRNWFEGILSSIDRKEISSFSEFETYGNFYTSYYSNFSLIEYKNKILSPGYVRFHKVWHFLAKFGGKHSVTYHNYLR